MEPEPRSDVTIDRLMRKAQAFTPNVVLYSERDRILLRDLQRPPSKAVPTNGGHSPHYDMFDVDAPRTAKVGQCFSDWKFNVLDFQLDRIKGWFMGIREVDADNSNLVWFLYMDGQFYFYNETTKSLKSSRSSGVVATKGKTLSFSNEYNQVTRYEAQLDASFSDFSEYLDDCFHHKSKHPLISFITSFKAFKKYPIVCEEIASYYRFFLTNPAFLLVLAKETTRTETLKDTLHLWIKAAGYNLISICKVWFYSYFQINNAEKCFSEVNFFFFDIIREVFMNSSSFAEFRKRFNGETEKNVNAIISYEFDDLPKYLIHIIYDSAKLNSFNDEQISIAIFSFIYMVLFGYKCDKGEFIKAEMIQKSKTFEKPNNLLFKIEKIITIAEINIFLAELSNNINYYESCFKSSNAATMIENYKNKIYPPKVRARPPSDASFILRANPAIRKPPIQAPDIIPTVRYNKPQNVPPISQNVAISEANTNNILSPIKEEELQTLPQQQEKDGSPKNKDQDNDLVKSAPRYSQTDEPPLEPKDPSDPTLQNE